MSTFPCFQRPFKERPLRPNPSWSTTESNGVIVIASHNGKAAAAEAFNLLKRGNSALDACVDAATRVEDDPDELTVGYGGLPNAEGVVELDASVMDGATGRAGAIAGLRDVRHAAQVARRVMEVTNRVLIAGEGARQFAIGQGFPTEDMLTDTARTLWQAWLHERSDGDDYVLAANKPYGGNVKQWVSRRFNKTGGTVHFAALDGNGNLAAATSSSGHAFKIPGRVGDAAVIGAGIYVDNDAGTCGSLGHGEATMQRSTSYFAVENMLAGMNPAEAGMRALERLAEKAPASLRDANGRVLPNVQLYLLNRDGEFAGSCLWGTKQIAVTDESGTRLLDCASLYGDRRANERSSAGPESEGNL